MDTRSNRVTDLLAWIARNARPAAVRSAWHEHVLRRRQRQWIDARTCGKAYLERRLPGGARMRLYLDSRVCRPIYVGTFERDEQCFVRRFLDSGDVFYDVGAHYGLFTLIASRRVGRGGRVVAIEPAPATRARLQANLDRNAIGNVDVVACAISDRAGPARLNVPAGEHDAWNSLAPAGAAAGGEAIAVEAVTLDELTARRSDAGRIALLKIDVEGWERHLLQGARQILGGGDAPVVMIEFSDAMMQRTGASCHDLYRDLAGLGYGLYRYDCAANRLVAEPCGAHYGYVNLIACKRREAVEGRLGNGGG